MTSALLLARDCIICGVTLWLAPVEYYSTWSSRSPCAGELSSRRSTKPRGALPDDYARDPTC